MEILEEPDEVISFRGPKNETTPRFRHLALNAEGIRYLNEAAKAVDNELSEQEQFKLLIIAQLCESEAVLDDLSSSSSSDSSSSDSSSQLSSSSDMSDSDNETTSTDNSEDNVFMVEDAIMHICVIYNISRTVVDSIIIELFNYTSLTREEISSEDTEFEPKK